MKIVMLLSSDMMVTFFDDIEVSNSGFNAFSKHNVTCVLEGTVYPGLGTFISFLKAVP